MMNASLASTSGFMVMQGRKIGDKTPLMLSAKPP